MTGVKVVDVIVLSTTEDDSDVEVAKSVVVVGTQAILMSRVSSSAQFKVASAGNSTLVRAFWSFETMCGPRRTRTGRGGEVQQRHQMHARRF